MPNQPNQADRADSLTQGYTASRDEEKLHKQVILDEMELYYTEVRDVNSKALLIIRNLAILYLTLLTYTFAGTQYALDSGRIRSVLSPVTTASDKKIDMARDNTMVLAVKPASRQKSDAVNDAARDAARDAASDRIVGHLSGFAIMTYGLMGVVFGVGLNLLGLVGILGWGRSKFLKMRYWKSISYLRQNLHNGSYPSDAPRLVALQTGAEAVQYPPYRGRVIRPLVLKHSYVLGYLLSAANLIFFLFTALVLAVAWDLGWSRIHDGQFDLFTSYYRSASRILIGFALLVHLHITMIHRYYVRDIRRSQFISRNSLDPKIKYREISNQWPNGIIAVLFIFSVLLVWIWPMLSSQTETSVQMFWRNIYWSVIALMAAGILVRGCATLRFRYSWQSLICLAVDSSRKTAHERTKLSPDKRKHTQ